METMINIRVDGKAVSVKSGTVLSDILSIEKPCGGRGTCGKCKVMVNGVDELACQYIIKSEIDVRTYEQSEMVSETGAEESGRLTLPASIRWMISSSSPLYPKLTKLWSALNVASVL